MIGKLTGTVDLISEDSLILMVGGVGYLVYPPLSTLSNLEVSSQLITLFIETVVKEDSITLYGFSSSLEQTWFRLLRTVQGVGARLALTLLSCFPAQDLYALILSEDKKTLTTADGVGAKLAIRLVTELKDRLLKAPHLQGTSFSPLSRLSNREESEDLSLLEKDALSALENLGYRRPFILKSLQSLRSLPNPPQNVGDIIRLCLKNLSQML